ncbi:MULTISPECIES: TetR/AcrR family transcriptional regulator [unclassified Paenibacillus]|uniref:TetR/AcrR family transcriptional regulator n=1 Tax=unclassified Paenibacillus TaxID=185978 RepID=UPI0030F58F9B
MPPKKQITAIQIVEKAFEMVRQEGYESITARKLAQALNCSTQPIYQSFTDMNGLKLALTHKAQEWMMKFISMNGDADLPAELSRILGYVQFANTEKYLFQLIFASGGGNREADQPFMPKESGIDLNMIIYAHGIVMMMAYNTLPLPWDTVKGMIVKAYDSFKRSDQ